MDRLIEEYLYIIKNQEIHVGPSKGKEGEDGKDIVAIEDKEKRSYCVYVIKAGHLNKKNLEGEKGKERYGILRC